MSWYNFFAKNSLSLNAAVMRLDMVVAAVERKSNFRMTCRYSM